MTSGNSTSPYDLVTCHECGSLQSRHIQACEKCGSKFLHSEQGHTGFLGSHQFTYWTTRIIGGLALIVAGPFLMQYAFTSVSSFPLLFIGIAMTVVGFPAGIWVLAFGDFPRMGRDNLPKYTGSGAPWAPTQTSEMLLGKTSQVDDDRAHQQAD